MWLLDAWESACLDHLHMTCLLAYTINSCSITAEFTLVGIVVMVEFLNVQLCSVLLTAMCCVISAWLICPSDGISDPTPCLSCFPQTMDSELSHSMVGSYLNPPERMYLPSFTQNEAFQNHHLGTSPKMYSSPNSQGNVNMKLYGKSGAAHSAD